MDEIDDKIITILKEDGRVKTLLESGAIKKFTIQVEVEKGAKAIALLSIKPSIPTSEISGTLIKIKGVESTYEVTGEYDVAAILSASNIMEVNRCIEDIRRIEGVTNTNTMIVLREWSSES